MQQVEIAGRPVEYVRAGTGTPVVFSPPTWWSLDAWQLNGIPELSADHDVVAFNHRGIGATGGGPEPYSIRSMSEDLVALADALQLDAFHIVGYANGSAVALSVAKLHPGRVRSLTLGAPSLGLPAHAPSPEPEIRSEVARFGFERHVRGHLPETAHPAFRREQPERFAALSDAMWLHLGTLENYLKHAEARRGYDAVELATGLNIPALVIAGAEDNAARGPISPVDSARKLVQTIPHAHLHIVERAAHMPYWEVPATWQTVRAFLTEADTRFLS